HTSRVDTDADLVSKAFREARYFAMSHNVSVIPIILRDSKKRFRIVYGARALNFKGSLDSSATPTYSPGSGTSGAWTLWRQSADVLDTLEKGAFVLMVGTSNLDLNSSGSQDA